MLRTCQRSSRPNTCCSPQNAKRPLPLGDILFARGLGEGSLQAEGSAIGGGPEDAKEPGEPGLVFKKPARRRDRETADQPPVSGQPNKRTGRFQAVIATSIDGTCPLARKLTSGHDKGTGRLSCFGEGYERMWASPELAKISEPSAARSTRRPSAAVRTTVPAASALPERSSMRTKRPVSAACWSNSA